MSQKRVTSQDVARRAGVSRTTVSFVLNDAPDAKISPATRERVRLAAAELGYIPDFAARTLVSGKTLTLGLLVGKPDLLGVDAFVPPLLQGLHEVCREFGYRLVIETSEVGDQDGAYDRIVRAKQIDGLVLLNPRTQDGDLQRLIDSEFPLVIIGRAPSPAAYNVNTESGTTLPATQTTTAHLIGLGHREIAFIHYRPISDLASDDRLRGYAQALDSAGISFDTNLVLPGAYSSESGYDAMRRMLASGARPSALVAGNDTIAIGAMAAAREAGLDIPADLAVVGHDDIPFARYVHPPLTTVRVPARAMGRRSGEVVIDLMQGRTPDSRDTMFPSEMIVRESCGAGMDRSQTTAGGRSEPREGAAS